MSIFDKFANGINQEDIKKAMSEAKENSGGEFKEVPPDIYEAELEKLEIGQTQKGADKLSAWFKINAGEYKGYKVFKNQVLNEGWQLGLAMEFIYSLGTGLECPSLKNMTAFQKFLDEVLDQIDELGLTYEINYTKDKKGFSDVKIEEVFED